MSKSGLRMSTMQIKPRPESGSYIYCTEAQGCVPALHLRATVWFSCSDKEAVKQRGRPRRSSRAKMEAAKQTWRHERERSYTWNMNNGQRGQTAARAERRRESRQTDRGRDRDRLSRRTSRTLQRRGEAEPNLPPR